MLKKPSILKTKTIDFSGGCNLTITHELLTKK